MVWLPEANGMLGYCSLALALLSHKCFFFIIHSLQTIKALPVGNRFYPKPCFILLKEIHTWHIHTKALLRLKTFSDLFFVKKINDQS